MDDHKPKLYARLRVKTGEYEADGKTKNRYSEVGVLFASPHFNNMYLQLETLPINKDWDGRIYVNPIEENKPVAVQDFKDDKQLTHEFNKVATDNVPTDISDDLAEQLKSIPF